jgi:hypothetical protein
MARVRGRKYLKTTVTEAIANMKEQSIHPTQSWRGLCMSSVRTAYRIPPVADSAKHFWESVPKEHRHYGKPSSAPRGAIMCYAAGKYGHATMAIGRRTHDKMYGVDYVRQGKIDVCPRTLPRWGLKYLGWTDWTPFGFIDLDS